MGAEMSLMAVGAYMRMAVSMMRAVCNLQMAVEVSSLKVGCIRPMAVGAYMRKVEYILLPHFHSLYNRFLSSNIPVHSFRCRLSQFLLSFQSRLIRYRLILRAHNRFRSSNSLGRNANLELLHRHLSPVHLCKKKEAYSRQFEPDRYFLHTLHQLLLYHIRTDSRHLD